MGKPEFTKQAARWNGQSNPEYSTLRQTHGNHVDSDDSENCTPGGYSYGDSPAEQD